MSTAPPPVRPATRGAGPSIDPRLRARRSEVARGRSRHRRFLLASLLGVVTLVVGALLLLHSPLFGAKVVRVKGSTHTPVSRIIAVAGLGAHPPLIDIDPAASAARIERLPWVASATVTRQWPDGVTVSVRERVPVAVVATSQPGRWLVVDVAGRVVEEVAAPPPGLVRMGLGGPAPGPGTAWLGSRGGPALRVAATLPRAFAGQVAQVSVNRQGAATLTLDQPLTVSLGAPVDLEQKYEDVAAILAGATLHAGDLIDVSVPAAPTVVSNA